MIELTLTIVGLAGAMTVPAFLTAVVESTASKLRPASVRATSPGGRQMKFVLVNGRTPRPDRIQGLGLAHDQVVLSELADDKAVVVRHLSGGLRHRIALQ